MSVKDFFNNGACDLEGLAKYLDDLPPQARIQEAMTFNSKQQQALWTAAEGGTRLTLADFVPDDKAPLEEVIHWGKNSLPVFSKFQKRFCKVEGSSEQSGYNEQFLKPFTGPGFFVCRETSADESDDHGIVIDYTMLPDQKVASWPTIVPTKARLGRFIYDGNHDFMRKVSKHVTIGRAKKAGVSDWMPNWFVLCRED